MCQFNRHHVSHAFGQDIYLGEKKYQITKCTSLGTANKPISKLKALYVCICTCKNLINQSFKTSNLQGCGPKTFTLFLLKDHLKKKLAEMFVGMSLYSTIKHIKCRKNFTQTFTGIKCNLTSGH